MAAAIGAHPGGVVPDDYALRVDLGDGPLQWSLRLTNFGHCGVFFEQVPVWQQLREQILAWRAAGLKNPKLLNLFSYTGCASLVAARAGAQVFHVDSSKGVLNWGKANAQASEIPAEHIRWIHEDVRQFLQLSRKKVINTMAFWPIRRPGATVRKKAISGNLMTTLPNWPLVAAPC